MTRSTFFSEPNSPTTANIFYQPSRSRVLFFLTEHQSRLKVRKAAAIKERKASDPYALHPYKTLQSFPTRYRKNNENQHMG